MPTRGEAITELTAHGMPFELVSRQVQGFPLRVFKNAPSSLREVWLTAAQRGDVPYFTYEDVITTYADAHRQVVSLAQWLTDNGVRKGDRVAIGMRNYPEWAIAFWAMQCIGAITVSLNAWWISDELRYALSDSGATAVIIDGERQDRLTDEMLAELNINVAVVTRGTARPGLSSWADAVGNVNAVMPHVEITLDDDATILYTSGTTGFPKGAIGTHLNYVTNLTNSLFTLALGMKRAGVSPPLPNVPRPQPVALSTFPFFHIAGLCGLIAGTNTGTSVVSQYKWDAGDALRLIEKYKIGSMGGVPTIVRSLLEHPDKDKFDLSSLISIGQGGAPAAPDTISKIENNFSGKVSAGNGYGLTETTAGIIGIAGAEYFANKDSIGFPVVSMDIKIMDDQGQEVPLGTIGELWAYGPFNVRGYWNKPEETAKAFTDGWFRTGDAGYIDVDGYIYVVDRIKDMVLRGGENVYCVEVETVLFEHPSIKDCAVIGLPHSKLGEEVVAVLVPKPGRGQQDTEELIQFLGNRLAPFKVPSMVFWQSDELPRNATGKVLKKDLRDQYADNSR